MHARVIFRCHLLLKLFLRFWRACLFLSLHSHSPYISGPLLSTAYYNSIRQSINHFIYLSIRVYPCIHACQRQTDGLSEREYHTKAKGSITSIRLWMLVYTPCVPVHSRAHSLSLAFVRALFFIVNARWWELPCRSLATNQPLIIGLICRKRPAETKHPMTDVTQNGKYPRSRL